MTFEYASVEDAIARRGLRMVVVGGVPSPWGESAKGILHMKGIDWTAVKLAYDSDAMKAWTGRQDGPVAMYDDERPRAGWAEILLLAERLAPNPPLLPKDAAQRALAFGLAHEIVGEEGLGWTRRVQLVHAGLTGKGGFPERAAKYLAKKYGYTPEAGAASTARVVALLRMLAARLEAQRAAGSDYYVGDTVTAVDVYGAAVCALFAPLPEEHCAMRAETRGAFTTLDDETREALAPVLLAHREMMYARWLELPLRL
ncbi:hypothetical protein [Caenimonas aquaedulcis]|uniref:Glutathione S-transferase n=1 Tax=Caenimonas aquaedulcis TaxID=2793270 RepID=A0A931H4Q8_9BURK|nr:hypothetical protein [Caenimonas aquaedulcis]MBG9388541.1 hypothetical protein [Caenimonas aquaedulcis]